DMLSNLLTLVFLEKMPGALDHDLRLVLRARNERTEEAITTARDGVLIREHHQRGLAPPGQGLSRMPHLARPRITRRERHHQRKGHRPRLIAHIGERAVVSREDVGRQQLALRHARANYVADG